MTIEFEQVGPEGLGQYARRASVESSVWFMGELVSFLADSEETGGRFSLMEVVVRKGDEPPRHVHHRELVAEMERYGNEAVGPSGPPAKG